MIYKGPIAMQRTTWNYLSSKTKKTKKKIAWSKNGNNAYTNSKSSAKKYNQTSRQTYKSTISYSNYFSSSHKRMTKWTINSLMRTSKYLRPEILFWTYKKSGRILKKLSTDSTSNKPWENSPKYWKKQCKETIPSWLKMVLWWLPTVLTVTW